MKKLIIIGTLVAISIIIFSMTTNIKTYVSMFINYTFYGSSKEALPQKLETEMDSAIAKIEKENIVLHDFYTLENPKLVKILIDYGARIDIKDNNGETPYSVGKNYQGNKRKEVQESLSIMKRKNI